MTRPADPDRRPARRAPASLPAFSLYGEPARTGPPLLHVESIDSRSRLYDWEIGVHVHRGLHQVVWVRSGQVESVLDEIRDRWAGPAALIVPPGVAHAFRFSPDSDGFVLTMHAALLAEGDAAAMGDALHALFAAPRRLALEPASDDAVRLQALFDALHAESRDADGADGPVPLWLGRAVVWRLARLGRRESQPGPRRAGGRQSLYTRWVVLLESHYREHWPVSRYAERLGLSAERLNRMVRAETGRNAQAVLHARLAREACRRLVHVAAPVSAVAFELGFDDPAYFSRFFKRHTGFAPLAYRARAARAEGEAGR